MQKDPIPGFPLADPSEFTEHFSNSKFRTKLVNSSFDPIWCKPLRAANNTFFGDEKCPKPRRCRTCFWERIHWSDKPPMGDTKCFINPPTNRWHNKTAEEQDRKSATVIGWTRGMGWEERTKHIKMGDRKGPCSSRKHFLEALNRTHWSYRSRIPIWFTSQFDRNHRSNIRIRIFFDMPLGLDQFPRFVLLIRQSIDYHPILINHNFDHPRDQSDGGDLSVSITFRPSIGPIGSPWLVPCPDIIPSGAIRQLDHPWPHHPILHQHPIATDQTSGGRWGRWPRERDDGDDEKGGQTDAASSRGDQRAIWGTEAGEQRSQGKLDFECIDFQGKCDRVRISGGTTGIQIWSRGGTKGETR